MRARNIKPGFYKNEKLVECSIAARLLAPGLWMLADREGRLLDKPKQIKMEVFPADNIEIEPLLVELHLHGHIVRYEIYGVKYIEILGFMQHQCPHFTEKPSLIPPAISKDFQKTIPSSQDITEALPTDLLNPDLLNPDLLNPECSPGGEKPRSEKFMLPEWIPKDDWIAWLEIRKKKKAPETKRALDLAVKDLEELKIKGADPARILQQSTKRGWTGLFPLSEQKTNGYHTKPKREPRTEAWLKQ